MEQNRKAHAKLLMLVTSRKQLKKNISLFPFNIVVLFESLQKQRGGEDAISEGINTGSIWTTQMFQKDDLCVIACF